MNKSEEEGEGAAEGGKERGRSGQQTQGKRKKADHMNETKEAAVVVVLACTHYRCTSTAAASAAAAGCAKRMSDRI